jgi:hypothetical protein
MAKQQTIYEIHQRKAEALSTETLRHDVAYYERKLEEAGRQADAYIAQNSPKLDLRIDSLLADCRVYADIIRASSEELGLRGE